MYLGNELYLPVGRYLIEEMAEKEPIDKQSDFERVSSEKLILVFFANLSPPCTLNVS
jgi:hypothetical protein